MIRIQVSTYNGDTPSQPLFAEFDETGGNIGRAEGNTLVLRDPARTISRTHASIAFRNGGYHIRNLGTAIPVYVNGQPLGNGQDTAIATGDEIRIGGYTMKVLAGGQSAPVLGSGSSAPASRDDPLLLFGATDEGNPFEDLLAPPVEQGRKKTAASQVREAGSPGPASIIPSDFDPFSEPRRSTFESREDYASQEARGSNDVLGVELGPSISSQKIDDLFDLSPEKNSDPFAPGSPLAPGATQFGRNNPDPLVAFGAASHKKFSSEQAQRDDVPELYGSFRPPEAKPDPAMRAVLPQEPPTPGVSSSEPYGMVLSWENKQSDRDSGEIKSVIVPSPAHDRRRAERRRDAHQAASASETPPQKVLAPAADHVPASTTAGPRVAPPDMPPAHKPALNEDELLHAFLKGAGLRDITVPSGLTPEFMNMLGQLLRESTQGTLDLLLARTLTKREVRAELTMIAPKENNPLKFSPTVEVALAHLLAPQGHGFMAPLQAMKDAQDDLRSHQFGFMAGLRAALAGVLERFNPEELERRLTQKTAIDSLLPFNRKAKLWDLFAERYKEISHEAEEDFHVLFGREFLRAYEAQVAKLEQEEKK